MSEDNEHEVLLDDEDYYGEDESGAVGHDAPRDETPISADAERTMLQSTLVRLALGAFVIVVLLIVIGLIALFAYRASRDKPIKVKIYPGAQLVNSEKLGSGKDHQQYVSTDSIEQIVDFYERQDDMTCRDLTGALPDQEGLVYIGTKCLIDRSVLDVTQYARVQIQLEGLDSGDVTGRVIIDIQREWGK